MATPLLTMDIKRNMETMDVKRDYKLTSPSDYRRLSRRRLQFTSPYTSFPSQHTRSWYVRRMGAYRPQISSEGIVAMGIRGITVP